MKEVKCPSGAVLKITPAPFADAKALYQALLKEGRGIVFNSKQEWGEVLKDMLCTGFSSPEVETKLWVCLERCTYNGTGADLKITPDSFEPVSAREDFTMVCMEVARENVIPFAKSLYAVFGQFADLMQSFQT